MAEDRRQSVESRRYIRETLGPWSSHPDVMVKQKRRLTRLGLIPFFLGLVWAVLVLTNYRTSDFAGVRDWGSFVAACGVLWGKVKLVALVLALLGCMSLGFTLTLNLLWLVGMTLARKELGDSKERSARGAEEAKETRKIVERDRLPFPWSVMIVFAFFWLVPLLLWQLRGFFSLIDWRLNLVLQVVTNMLCIVPLAALLAWTKWAGGRTPGPDEELRHSIGHLLSALALLVGAVVVWTAPRPAFFDRFLTSRFLWVLRCGIDADTAYRWFKLALGAGLALWGAFHLLLWRLKTIIRPKVKNSADATKESKNNENSQQEKTNNDIPAGAQYLLKNLENPKHFLGKVITVLPGPKGAPVYRRAVGQTSDEQSEVKSSDKNNQEKHQVLKKVLSYLMGGGKEPEKDQRKFFYRYVEAFENARNEFAERTNFTDGKNRADMLLLGEDGSGRTEILLASALYAVVVRGQRALYLCADMADCQKLAMRASERLAWMGVDVYLSTGVLQPLQVEALLDPKFRTPLPDLLFTIPEDAERAFFANPRTHNPETAKVVRETLTSFGAVFVDDFLEMSMSRRSHTAFLLDKLKLLQAADSVLAQYAVVTGPLRDPKGEENIGSRLFGTNGFDRANNVIKIQPRRCDDYWFGTLRVARGAKDCNGNELTLEDAVRELATITAEGGGQALFYQKGMSEEAKRDFCDKIGPEAIGKVQVASHYRELEELEQKPDNVFYLSLASGEAGMALRLNIGEGGDPVFFRITLEGEQEVEPPIQYGLLPDKTAMTLRIHHLRNVLQFIEEKVPIPDEVWGRFQIKMDHQCIRELEPGHTLGALVVSWMHDLLRDKAYAEGELGAYLTLETSPANLSFGRVNFNCLPTDSGSIWKVSGDNGRLLLAEAETAGTTRDGGHLALWKTNQNDPIGEWDLSHNNHLVYSDTDEWVPLWIEAAEEEEKQRYALRIIAHYRHGNDAEFIHLVRHLEWKIRRGELRVKASSQIEESAHFQVERIISPTCRVNGAACGLLNRRGDINPGGGALPYSYDAYLSCWVLLPIPCESNESETERAMRCLDGTWQTTAESGYSCALTHALTTALKRKIADWLFFAVTPAFWTDCQADSMGRATVWIVESGNSGRVAQPLLRELAMENREFRESLYRDALRTLEECKSLEDLRMASGLAFAGETLEVDDRKKATELLELLLDKKRAGEWEKQKRKEWEEARRKRREEKRRPRSDERTSEEREFEKVVIDALKRFDDAIDVSRFAAEYGWGVEQINDRYNDALWNHPEVFWVAKSCRYRYSMDPNGKLVRFSFIDLYYAFGPEELLRKQAEIDTAVAEAMEKAKDAADGATKALRLHDYIVQHCEYDTEAMNSNDQSPLARTAYSALVRGKAVCEGYAMAYRYLLSRVGIESEEVISASMEHRWNYVRLGDNWYHVDVTWDDPTYPGKDPATAPVLHDYFLLSDEAIRAKEHHDWDVRGLPSATDTTYDKHDWDNASGHQKREQREREQQENKRPKRERHKKDQESEERVPWQKFKNHFLFQMKERGNVKKCCGKVHLRIFFVDDGNSSWDDSSRTAYMEIVDDISKRLEREGNASGAAIKVSWSTENRTISQSIQRDHVRQNALGKSKRSRKKEPDDWLYEALGVDNDAAVATAQNDFKRDNGYDEAPIVFVFNKDFRSTARCSKSSSRCACGEWTMISLEDNLYENPNRVRKVLLHELLHLFGAEDLYYHPTVKEASDKFLPDSVMSDGDTIDDLTRVLIGWDENLSANAIAFLNAIKDVSAKEFEDAQKKDSKKKWH